MPTPSFCAEQAETCELMALEVRDPRLKSEWLMMAREWRLAAEDRVVPLRPAGTDETGEA